MSSYLTNIGPFIDKGWHTVPFNCQSITRNGKSKKFTPPKNWDKFKDEFNESPTLVGAAITGEKSNISVLDCDSTSITQLVLAFLPSDYKGITKSIGKVDKEGNPIESASVFFKYSPLYPPTLNQGPMGLEWFNGGSARMVFLPTLNNRTKEPWDTIPELIECPRPILDLIEALAQPQPKTQVMVHYEPQHSTNLAPLLVQELEFKRLDQTLFTIITPKSFKHLSTTMLPQDVPSGSGSSWLNKVSAILGSDASVSDELYEKFIRYLNSLRPSPANEKELTQTIINPMVSGTAQINNEPIWRYNPHWEKDRLTVINRISHSIELMYDSLTKTMYEINHTKGLVGTFKKMDIVDIVSSIVSKKLPHQPPKFMPMLPNFEVNLYPTKAFGPINRYEYNTFIQSPALEVLSNPDSYKPTPISNEAYDKFGEYITAFVPDEDDRAYLLNHLFTKLTTFEYSAVIYYIVGVSGSGKGRFAQIINQIVGQSYMSLDLGKNEIIEKYNSWLHNKFFIQFDELHRQLDGKEFKAANERIKGWTGSTTFALRKMQSGSEPNVPMLATFIFTQNGNNMPLDENDRRYLYIDTPNQMSDELAEFFTDLTDEKMTGVAAYLLNNCTKLTHKEYKQPPFTEKKRKQIIEKMPLVSKLVRYIHEEEWIDLYTIAVDAGVTDEEFFEGQSKNILFTDVLVSIVLSLAPNYRGPLDSIKHEIKQRLVRQGDHPYTTRGGKNVHVIKAHGFNEFIPPIDTDDDTNEEINL